jgi:hypothetical protein
MDVGPGSPRDIFDELPVTYRYEHRQAVETFSGLEVCLYYGRISAHPVRPERGVVVAESVSSNGFVELFSIGRTADVKLDEIIDLLKTLRPIPDGLPKRSRPASGVSADRNRRLVMAKANTPVGGRFDGREQRAAPAAVGSIVADDGRKPSLFCTELTRFCPRSAPFCAGFASVLRRFCTSRLSSN